MSVRKGDQDEGDLKVIQASKELVKYTFDRVKSESVFPKAQRWLMAKSVWEEAVNARGCIVRANAIRVEDKTSAEKRLTLEKEAIGHLEHLSSLLDICNIVGYISDDRMEYWGKLITDTMIPLKGWLKSDRQRYKQYKG